MNIIVCIKQVPDTAEISINPETGTLNRTGVESIINPLDLNALEAALTLRSCYGGKVTVLTMGPKQADESLKEAVAMGVDRAVLCSDKKFAGADTWATACTLEASIRYLGLPDIILCGKQAIDGDTAQVPAELAVRLGIPFIPYVSEIQSINNGTLQVKSMTDSGFALLQTTLPAVCSVVKSINVPRLISLAGWIQAFSTDIDHIAADQLTLTGNNIGLKGSPTRVKKITPVSHSKSIQYLDADSEKDLTLICGLLEKAHEGVSKGPGYDAESEPQTAADPHGHPHLIWDEADLTSLRENNELKCNICILGEIDPDTSQLHSVTFELLGEGKRLAEKKGINLILVLPYSGKIFNVSAKEIERIENFNVHSVICIDTGVEYGFEANRFAGAAAAVLSELSPEIVLAPATLGGRAFVPLVASKLTTGLTADCTQFDIDSETGLLKQTRPAFGGNIMATIITPDHKPQMATVRPHVLQIPKETGNESAQFKTAWYRITEPVLASADPAAQVSIIEYSSSLSSTEDISNASIIISGGRGVGASAQEGEAGFPLLQKLAAAVQGSVGASRSTVEAGWAPYHQQVGQTGKTVQPKLYIACGISGAVQHLVGMHDSDTIIAINKDPEAPIFGAADYGFIDDYSRVIKKILHCLINKGKS